MAALFESTENIHLLEECRLASYTTFRLGGPAKGILQCDSPQALERAVSALNAQNLPFILLGGGSNLVVSDDGLDCYVIRYVSDRPLIRREGNNLRVSGSTNFDDLARYAVEQGLSGLTFASGIPGTVGGAVVGNAGAFGQQVGDVLQSVELIGRDGRQRCARRDELGLTYRHSSLKDTGEIVAAVVLKLESANSEALKKERAGILKTRAEKHPDLKQNPCAGSFFRNIEPTSNAGRRQAAGWFLDQAGGKALSYGGAGIYHKHANIIVKHPQGTAQDVYELSRLMANLAKEHFDLDLIREVRFAGEFHNQPAHPGKWIW